MDKNELAILRVNDIIKTILHDRIFIEMSTLITYGGTLLNRDGNGYQKQLTVGGYTRDAISSQCRKAAIRCNYEGSQWDRSRFIGKKIKNEIAKMYPDATEEYLEAAERVAYALLSKNCETDKEKKKVKYSKTLLCLSNKELESIAKAIVNEFPLDNEEEIANATDFSKKGELVASKRVGDLGKKLNPFKVDYDVALFGRMSTESDVITTIRGAAGYNFSFSTNKSNSDVDYFIGRDTFAAFLNPFEQNGAGHLDERPVNSNCFYEYCNFNLYNYFRNCLIGFTLEELNDSKLIIATLKDATDHLIDVLWRTMIVSPTAMQTQMASWPTPDCVYVTVKKGYPESYERAFEKPVVASRNESVSEKSIKRLIGKIEDDTFETGEVLHGYWICEDYDGPKDAERMKMKGCLKSLKDNIYDLLKN